MMQNEMPLFAWAKPPRDFAAELFTLRHICACGRFWIFASDPKLMGPPKICLMKGYSA